MSLTIDSTLIVILINIITDGGKSKRLYFLPLKERTHRSYYIIQISHSNSKLPLHGKKKLFKSEIIRGERKIIENKNNTVAFSSIKI